MTSRERHQLSGVVLLHYLELLLHCRLPCWIILGLGEVGRFAGVRQVQLSEEALRWRRWRMVVKDVHHRAVSQWLAIVVGVKSIFIIL
jgi:hypothetical protein